ncbi:MAG: IPT/TIG domain-containing protein [bacterium]|nr:MAG: IPT/TIG domain-containing protein [bacterium]
MRHAGVTRVPHRNILLLLPVIALTSLLCLSGEVAGSAFSPPEGGSYDLDDIHELYYEKGRTEEAIQLLTEAINAGKIRYTRSNLQGIVLKILKSYFEDPQKDATPFSELVYRVMNKQHMKTIDDYFRGSSRLYPDVEKAIKRWKTPKTIKVKPEEAEIEVGKAQTFEVIFKNDKGAPLDDIELQCAVMPQENGIFYRKNNRFEATKPGDVSLQFAAKDYMHVSAVVKITVTGSLPVEKPPLGDIDIKGFKPTKGIVGTEVTIYGENFGDGPYDNYRVDFGGTGAKVKEGSNTVLKVLVPAGAKEGPISITAEDGRKAASVVPFTFIGYDDPSLQCPSKMPLIISALVCVGTGVGAIVTEEDTQVALGSVAGATAIATGYLLYRYTKKKKECMEAVKEHRPDLGLIIERDYRGVLLVFRF